MNALKSVIWLVLCVHFFNGTMCAEVGSYMHPEDLMPLVHGEFKGTLWWMWDLCYEQHPYFFCGCVTVAAFVVVYEVSPRILAKANAWLQKLNQQQPEGKKRNPRWQRPPSQ